MGQLVGIARRAKPREQMEELTEVSVSVDAGLEGDFRGGSEGRPVTVLSREVWEAACRDLGEDLPWVTRRANLLVEDVRLPQLIGAEVRIGGVLLKVSEETAPCSLMEKARTGLRAALTPDWRGGIACTVVEGARIKIGDDVDVETGNG